jgi:hypothetical protein
MPGTSGRAGPRMDSVILGTFLIASPWLFGFAPDAMAAWSAGLTGIAIMAAAFLAPSSLGAKLDLALGGWTTLAPVVLGFDGIFAAALIHAGSGLVLAVLAVFEIWAGKSSPPAMRV